MRILKSVTLGALTASLIALGSLVGTDAHAATAACTKEGLKNGTGNGTIYVPVSSGSSETCERQPHGGYVEATSTIQFTLYICHGINITVDGIYGSKTIAAIRKVQEKAKTIAVDGVYGKNTHNNMKFVEYQGLGRCLSPKSI